MGAESPAGIGSRLRGERTSMEMETQSTKKRMGLVPRLIFAILTGILIGSFLPEWFCRLAVTASGLFGTFLKFVIPLMILAFVTMGIADLSQGAGKLLGLTAGISYASTLIAGSASFLAADILFPYLIHGSAIKQGQPSSGASLESYLSLSVEPVLDTLAAVLLAFILGLSLSSLRGKGGGNTLYGMMDDFSHIINQVLHSVIVPLLPLYICGTFVDMTFSGKTFAVLGVLWKVFLVVLALHLIYLILLFSAAGSIGRKNPFTLLKNQIPGYMTALGTQSSAATIPVNLECAEKDGISEEIRNFVVPLCANIHMAGSMITITSCAVAVTLLNEIPLSYSAVIGFIATLGIAMVASPGAPGGSIMTALPFLPMVGLGSESLSALMIALYITQDSFGTACNVSGDNAIGVIVDRIYRRWIKPSGSRTEE